MQVIEDEDKNRYLSVVVELAPELSEGGASNDNTSDRQKVAILTESIRTQL